ncbi:MAG TPA: dynamin family protein [Leptolyngbyaceae cyanobacterium]
MNKIEQIVQSKPLAFDYLALIHNDLISERGNFQPILRAIKSNLELKHIKSISMWLDLVKIDIDRSLEKSWLVTDLIIQAVTSTNFTYKITLFDPIFDVLELDRKQKTTFFTREFCLIIQQHQDIGSSESITLRKIKSYLQTFTEELEEKLFNIANNIPELRFVILRLLTELPLNPDHNYGNKELKKYEKIVETERLSQKRTLAELEKLDKYLEYCKQLRKRASHYLDDYLDKQLDRRNQEIITETKTEELMTNMQTIDDIREKLATELKELCNFLSDKGMTDESSQLVKELKKLEENTYQIAFIATMKAGKSSLINALLGSELLPSLEKSCTGRLTFINHHDGETVAHIIIRDNLLVVSYREPKDLEKYLNKYLQSGLVEKAEIYCPENLGWIDNVQYVNQPFEEINENLDIHIHQAKLILKENEIFIKDVDAVELGSFINNKYVDELKIDTPIRYLKKHIQLDGIQFVDTPGPNSAAHSDHKRITYNFIDK